MYNHEPKGYHCPFCLLASGVENKNVLTKQDDIVYQDRLVTAFIASHWWPKNAGHVIIIPNKHFENIYDLPDNLSARIHKIERMVAIAFKAVYHCDGVSSRQHNESAGNQDVWHYHLHVFPRYKNDQLYEHHAQKQVANPEERKRYSKKIRTYFQKHPVK